MSSAFGANIAESNIVVYISFLFFLRVASHLVNVWQELNGTATKAIPELHDRYGSVVRIARDTLSFNEPGAWKDANDADHARYRKLISHAFSDHAIREQEPLMMPYFDLRITRLEEEIDSQSDGIVDMTKWYNFTTFDIIGDLTYAKSFGALQNGGYHEWMAMMLAAMKFVRIVRAAEFYPLVIKPLLRLVLRARSGTWDVNAARKKHREYTSIRTRERDLL